MVLSGLLVLLVGLWWVQLVSSRRFQEKMETQSIRTIRIPAVRGKILDCNGRVLAENRPSYSIDLYVEELSKSFQSSYSNRVIQVKLFLAQQKEARQKLLGRKLTPAEAKEFALNESIRSALQKKCRYEVCAAAVSDLAVRLQEPISFDEKKFESRYEKARVLPMTVLDNLTSSQLAKFEEQSGDVSGLDLDVQSLRHYPNGSLAAHVLGYLARNNDSTEDETSDYNYRLIDYVGQIGIEGQYDRELRGTAGEKFVVVNYLGYRQSETINTASEPGDNVILTLDAEVQKIAESALQRAQAQCSRRGSGHGCAERRHHRHGFRTELRSQSSTAARSGHQKNRGRTLDG